MRSKYQLFKPPGLKMKGIPSSELDMTEQLNTSVTEHGSKIQGLLRDPYELYYLTGNQCSDSPHITKQTVGFFFFFFFFSMGIKVSGSCKSGQPTVLS